MNRQNYL